MNENIKTYAIFGSLILISVLVFLPVWSGLISAWAGSDDYSHGFLIVPLALYIVWQKRREFRAIELHSNWTAFPLVVLALLLYLIGQFGEIKTVASLAMVGYVAAAVLFLLGWQVFKRSIFPLALLLFMIPVPGQIYASLTIPLQLFVTKMTAIIVSALNIPILREGNVLHLPEHTLQVVDACSGLRSIMSLLTLGAVIGYFGLRSNPMRWLLFVSAIPVAVFVNIVRVLIMVMAFYFFDTDLTDGAVHTYFGVGVFVLAILFFLAIRKGLSLCEK